MGAASGIPIAKKDAVRSYRVLPNVMAVLLKSLASASSSSPSHWSG